MRPAPYVFSMAVCVGVLAPPAGVVGQEPACDAVIRPVLVDPPAAAPDSASRGDQYWHWSHAFERETTGVGVLSPTSRPGDDPPGYDWLPEISLPLYARPGDEAPGAWIHEGWWVTPGNREDDRPMGYRGMMETSYEESSLVVTGTRPDGWLQVWVDIGPIPRATSHGLMWAHECLLDLGGTPLKLILWEEMFTGQGAPPLSFLGDERHALRAAPGVEGEFVAWLDRDDEVEIVEIRGDWARVRAFKPGVFLTGCLGDDWDGEELAGWVKWRDDASGTWLWYPTRGC